MLPRLFQARTDSHGMQEHQPEGLFVLLVLSAQASAGELTCKTPDELQLILCDEGAVGEGCMQLLPEGV